MSNSAYNNTLRVRLQLLLFIMGVLALSFFWLQNAGVLAGGSIALPKLLWLAYAILFWFCLPLLIILDHRINHFWRSIFRIFLLNMFLRAVIELIMMYMTSNWSPYYGIAHDVFTIGLLITLLVIHSKRIQLDIFLGYIITMSSMFMLEIIFVFYMLEKVVTDGAVVYFVPEGGGHNLILNITWVAVIALTGYMFIFTKRWLRGEFIRTGA